MEKSLMSELLRVGLVMAYAEKDEKIKQLEKALDKACEVMTNRVNIDRGDGYPTLNFTKEAWKEWCMKDG